MRGSIFVAAAVALGLFAFGQAQESTPSSPRPSAPPAKPDPKPRDDRGFKSTNIIRHAEAPLLLDMPAEVLFRP